MAPWDLCGKVCGQPVRDEFGVDRAGLANADADANALGDQLLAKVVETGPTQRVFTTPQHPYTAALLEAAPRPDPATRHRKPAIRGDIPSPLAIPRGLAPRRLIGLAGRHAFLLVAEERCVVDDPQLQPVDAEYLVACHVLPFRDGLTTTKEAAWPRT
jgi:oligopeptide/dipeptide ABC transporter ATP-binding protein